MCNLSEGIWQEAEAIGEARGEARGRETREKEILEAMTRKLQSEYPEMSPDEALAKAKSYIPTMS